MPACGKVAPVFSAVMSVMARMPRWCLTGGFTGSGSASFDRSKPDQIWALPEQASSRQRTDISRHRPPQIEKGRGALITNQPLRDNESQKSSLIDY
jgi:hypothetical protein